MEELLAAYHSMLSRTKTNFHRYLYDEIDWQNRLIGITGPRGVGKTTLLLQHIKEKHDRQEVLYVTVEDFYFSTHRLTDLAKELVQRGVRWLYIDEIHKYPEWSRELKLIYDYYPDLNVVFTGSSVLDIRKGASDLSRRAIMYAMQGLSFREYLGLFHKINVPVYSLEEITHHGVKPVEGLEFPLPLFKAYLKTGYYPFSRERGFNERLREIVGQTLETDIPVFAGMNAYVGHKLKRLMGIISESVPFKPNFTKIASMLDVSRNVVGDYLLYMEEAGMITRLRDDTGGIRGLGKVEKTYLDNTNLIYSLVGERADIGNVRETFFMNQTRLRNEVISSPISDFQIAGMTFEVGGKSKGQKQLAGAEQAFVVKDDIETDMLNIIPLWYFGLTY